MAKVGAEERVIATRLWQLLSTETLEKLKAKFPHACTVAGHQCGFLVVVGDELKWLLVHTTDSGNIRCTVWAVIAKGTKTLADEVVPEKNIDGLLKVWAPRYCA